LFLNGNNFVYPAAAVALEAFNCAANQGGPTAASVGFCDQNIDAAIRRALHMQLTNPQAANRLWAKVDRLVTDRAPWIPLVNSKWVDFVSKRVGNYQYHPTYAMLFDQVWVR